MKAMRLLISAQANPDLLERVAGVLEAAVSREPETFTKVKDVPGTVDHYGYETDELSSVVLAEEYPGVGVLYRLTIRPGEHEVFDNLLALVRDYYFA